MLTTGLMLASLLFFTQTAAEPEQGATNPAVHRSYDQDQLITCRRQLVGFRNVNMECTSDQDGRLRQCQLLSDDPRLRRYRSRFECMAAAVTIHDDAGVPLPGRRVRMAFGGVTLFAPSSDEEDPGAED